jgi:hypothetical protein
MKFESDRQFEIDAHRQHLRYIYTIHGAGLALSALALVGGAIMTFRGLESSFNWAVEVPHSIGAKLTNASPGIVFCNYRVDLGYLCIAAEERWVQNQKW